MSDDWWEKPQNLYIFDAWLDDSQPWRAERYRCPECQRVSVLVVRTDRTSFCPYCTITDRVSVDYGVLNTVD